MRKHATAPGIAFLIACASAQMLHAGATITQLQSPIFDPTNPSPFYATGTNNAGQVIGFASDA